MKFFVSGEPQQKGSTKGFYVRKIDRVVITTTNRDLKAWELRIATEAQRALENLTTPWPSPGDRKTAKIAYGVVFNFAMPRPPSLPNKYVMPTKRPDLDKLVRAAFDGMNKIVYPDDCQITEMQVKKFYATADHPVGLEIEVYVIYDPNRDTIQR